LAHFHHLSGKEDPFVLPQEKLPPDLGDRLRGGGGKKNKTLGLQIEMPSSSRGGSILSSKEKGPRSMRMIGEGKGKENCVVLAKGRETHLILAQRGKWAKETWEGKGKRGWELREEFTKPFPRRKNSFQGKKASSL